MLESLFNAKSIAILISGASILMALTMLIATAALLGVVTWLSQAREDDLAVT